jgi:hypothetical protein
VLWRSFRWPDGAPAHRAIRSHDTLLGTSCGRCTPLCRLRTSAEARCTADVRLRSHRTPALRPHVYWRGVESRIAVDLGARRSSEVIDRGRAVDHDNRLDGGKDFSSSGGAVAGASAPALFVGSAFGGCAVRLEPRRGKSKRHTSLVGVALGMEPGRLATTVTQRQIRVPQHGHCSPARDRTRGYGRRGNRWLGRRRLLILPQPEVAQYFQRKARDCYRWLHGMRHLQQRVGINLNWQD